MKIESQNVNTPEVKKADWWKDIITNFPSHTAPETIITNSVDRVYGDVLNAAIINIAYGDKGYKEPILPPNEDFYDLLFKVVIKQTESPLVKMPKEEIVKYYNRFVRELNQRPAPMKNASSRSEYFEGTNQYRQLIEENEYDYRYFLKNLFAIDREALDVTPLVLEYLKLKLDGKSIYLLGGGKSARDLIKSNDIKPSKVINIDPYIISEPIDLNSGDNYLSLPVKAETRELLDTIESMNLPKADEIWATYSVPHYLEKSSEILDLFKNIDSLLNAGGICRIMPLSILTQNVSVKNDFENEDSRLRTNAFAEGVRNLVDSDRYNIAVFDETLILQKIK